ncbi:hypothetical protein LZ30DRAFT_40610 [Colletotrichum cereale]|nr:hypothetical protein LZ30DRAFT_40610 [Colletotrichum cereale]
METRSGAPDPSSRPPGSVRDPRKIFHDHRVKRGGGATRLARSHCCAKAWHQAAAAAVHWTTTGLPHACCLTIYDAGEFKTPGRGKAQAQTQLRACVFGRGWAPCQACCKPPLHQKTEQEGSSPPSPLMFRWCRCRKAGRSRSMCDPNLGSGRNGGFRMSVVLCAAGRTLVGDTE